MADKNELPEEMDREDSTEDMIAEIPSNVLRLDPPVIFEGETVSELEFDFSKLTAADSLAIEREVFDQTGRAVLVASISGDYMLRAAARACISRREDGKRRFGLDFFMALPLSAYMRLRTMVRNFM